MRRHRPDVRSAAIAVLSLAALVLAACDPSGTTMGTEEAAAERLTRSEIRFVQLSTDAHAQFLVTATSLFLVVPEIRAGNVATDEVQELIDKAYATLEVWDGFTPPSERLAPAVDAWFRVLDEEWDFISAWVDVANEPGSKPTLKACLKQLSAAGDSWGEYEQAVMAAAEPVPGGVERVQPILDGLEGNVQEIVDEFGS